MNQLRIRRFQFYSKLLPILFGIFAITFAANAYGQADSLAKSAGSCASQGCSATFMGYPGQAKIILLAVIALMASVYFTRKYNKKIFLYGGLTITFLLTSLLFLTTTKGTTAAQNCQAAVTITTGTLKDTVSSAEFLAANDEFAPMDGEAKKNSPGSPSGISPTEEFREVKSAGDEFSSAGSEFATPSGDFKSLDEVTSTNEMTTKSSVDEKTKQKRYRLLYELGVLFALLITISYLIKFETFRKTRGLFLLASVAYLGFYKGACPCMILSFQNTVLSLLGEPIDWVSMVWFLGLIPLTYFFGKVWCGWLCHLGGLQDFLFQTLGLDILKSNKAQTILRYTRISLLVILIIQLILTRTNIYIHYDPFKVAFNLISANKTGYFLLALLLISSVLIYRPFCRAICPVGLILGWVSLIPGATRLSKKESCVDCISCQKSCRNRSMLYEGKKSILNVQDCILCGDCLGSCKKSSLYINRNRI